MQERTKQINQVGHLTQINKQELKKCPDCGDYQEFLRKAMIFKGTEAFPEKILKKLCYCQEQNQNKILNIMLKKQENTLLMEKYTDAIPPRFINWDFSKVDESENKKACEEYVNCFDINLLTGKGLFLIGDMGRGKSTLCYCMTKGLISNGYTARVDSLKNIIRKLQETNKDSSKKTYNQVLKDYLKFDFTGIDDFGRETYTEKQLSVVFDFINEMNKNKKCIAISANPESIAFMKSKKFQFKEQFEAILDRLNEMCTTTLFFKGETFRKPAV